KGQITLCLFILTDDEIYDTLAPYLHVIRRCVVYDDMNALNMYSPFSFDKRPYMLWHIRSFSFAELVIWNHKKCLVFCPCQRVEIEMRVNIITWFAWDSIVTKPLRK